MNTRTSKFLAIIAVLAMVFAVVEVVSTSEMSDAGSTDGHFYYIKNPANGTVAINIDATEQGEDFEPDVGDVLTFTTTPTGNYYLKSFTYAIGDGEPKSVPDSLTVTQEMKDSYVNFTAVFAELREITFVAPEHGTMTVYVDSAAKDSGAKIQPGKMVLVSTVPAEGYRLTTLTAGGNDIRAAGYFIMPDSNTVIEAAFTELFTIDYDNTNMAVAVKGGGAAVAPGDEVTAGTLLTVTVTAPEDKYLSSFKVNSIEQITTPAAGKVSDTYTYDTAAIAANTVFAATFGDTFDVTVPAAASIEHGTITVIGDGVLPAGKTTTVISGQVITIIAVPEDGYELSTLTYNGTDILSTKSFTVTANSEIAAEFDGKSYEIADLTDDLANANVTIELDGVEKTGAFTAKAGQTIRVSYTPVEGYEGAFDTLTYTKAPGGDSNVAFTATATGGYADIVVGAWGITGIAATPALTPTDYTITLPDGNFTPAGYAGDKHVGDAIEITITPNANFRLTELKCTVEGATCNIAANVGTITFTMPADDIVENDFTITVVPLYSIAAPVAPASVTATAFTVDGDAYVPPAQTVEEGQEIVMTVTTIGVGTSVKTVVVTTASGNVEVSIDGNVATFTMPDENVTSITITTESSYVINFGAGITVTAGTTPVVSGVTRILADTKITVAVDVAENKLLTKLTYTNGFGIDVEIDLSAEPYVFSMPGNDTTVKATLVDAVTISEGVIVDPEGVSEIQVFVGSELVDLPAKIVKGSTVRIVVTTDDEEYTITDLSVENNKSFKAYVDVEIDYEVKEYMTVTFSAPQNGTLELSVAGKKISSGDRVVNGTVVTVSAVKASDNYQDAVVTVTGADYNDGTFVMGDENVTVSATFAPVMKDVTITFKGETEIPETISVNVTGVTEGKAAYGSIVKVSVDPKQMTLEGLTLNGEIYVNGSSVVVDGDLAFDIVATQYYTVNITAPANGSLVLTAGDKVIVSGDKVEAGTEILVTAEPASENYILDKITGVVLDDEDMFELKGNVTVSAIFKPVDKAITVLVNGEEEIPAGIKVTISGATKTEDGYVASYGSTVIVNFTFGTMTLDSLTYTIKGGDAQDLNNGGSIIVSDDILIEAEIYQYYTVNITAPANGTIELTAGDKVIVSGDKVLAGTVITVTAEPASDNYVFDKFTGVEVVDGKFTLTKDVTVSAVFKPVDKEIIILINGEEEIPAGVTVTVNGATKTEDGYVAAYDSTISVVIDAGAMTLETITYSIGGAEPVKYVNGAAVVVSGDIVFDAEVKQYYTITWSAQPNITSITVTYGGAAVTSGQKVEADAEKEVVIDFEAADGFIVKTTKVTMNGGDVPFTKGEGFALTGNITAITISGEVEPNKYTVAWDNEYIVSVNGTVAAKGQIEVYEEANKITVVVDPQGQILTGVKYKIGNTDYNATAVAGKDNTYEFNATGNVVSITPQIVEDAYKINYDVTSGGVAIAGTTVTFTSDGTTKDYAVAGKTVTVSIVPATGYKVSEVTVVGIGDITKNLRFVMPEGEATVHVVLEADYEDLSGKITTDRTLGADSIVTGDVTIEKGVTLTVPAGKTLNLNGWTVKVYGDLVIEEGAVVINEKVNKAPAGDFKGYIMVEPKDGDLVNSGVIGAGLNAVTIGMIEPGEDDDYLVDLSAVRLNNVTGLVIEFDVVDTEAKTDVYGIELSGTISKYSATKTGQTATAAFLGGTIYDLTVGANVTVTFIFSDLAYGSELTVEGTIIGTLSTNGTAVINITTGSAGNADHNMFVAAYTGKYVNTISVDKFDKDNLGVTKFELSNLTGLKIEVIESEKKIGKKTYNVYTAQISGSAANKNADKDASIEVSGFIPEDVEGYIPEAGVTIKDTTLAYNATKKKGVTLTIGEVAGEKTSVIVDGKITMGKAEQFVDTAVYAKSSYATYSEGTTTVVYYVSDFVSAVDNIAKAKDKTVKQYGTVDIDGTMEVTAGVITVNGTIDVSGQLTVSGAEINGNGINEVTGKVVKKATATMAAPKEYNVTYTSGTDIAYCGLQTALDESVVGSIIKLNEDVALTKDLTIPAGRTIDTNNYALFVNGTITVNGTLKASGLVTAYAVIVNGIFDSVISGEDDLIVLYDPEDTKTGALTVNGTLRADGNIVVGKTLAVAKNAKFTADNTFVGYEYDGEELSGIAGASADIAGEMTIDGVFFVNGNLTVSGKISITEDLAANGNVKVSGEIASEDDIAFGADEKTVTVTGTVVTEGKITLFGTIEASAGFIAALEYDVENAAAINGAGVILVNNETYPLYTVLTSVARAVELANADIEDEDDAQEVVLMGTLSAGNIQLAERVSLFVVNGAKVTLGTVTMKTSAVEEETIFEAVAVDDGAQLTATVVGTNGATIRLSKAQGLFVNVYSEKVETDVYVNKTRLATLGIEGSTIADSVEIAGGKVVLEGFVYDNTVGEDHKVGTFTVANGATAEGTFTAGVDIIVNINGTLSAENVVVKKILNIAGTVTVVNDGTLTVTEAGSAVDVAGSLVIVAADADNDKAAGIASILKLTVSGKATVAGTLKATTVEVKGTMTVSGQVAGIDDDAVTTLKVSGTMTVNGEKDITVTNLTVIGTVSVADSAKLFANKAIVGTKRTSLAAAASVNALYLTGNNTSAVVYSGATANVYGENGSDAVFTTVTINGVDYMTAYIPYGSNTTLAQIIPENEFDGIKGIETVDAEGNHVIYEAVKTTVVGSVAIKDAKAEVNEAIVRLSAIDHVVIFIDNIRYSNGDIIPGTVGKHTITINIEPGYKGTTKITFNGTSVTDSYTITTSMVSGTDVLILSVTGDIQVDPGVEPTPTPEKESEWTVTTILLVVLVILIAVLAIVVILRLNRN